MTEIQLAPNDSGRADGRARTDSVLLGQVAVFVIGASTALQVANFTVTAASFICLMLIPAFLLMRHRGVELLPLLFAVLGWISYLASTLVNDVSVLYPNAVAPAAFSIYFIGFHVVTDKSVDRIATLLAGISVGTIIFFVTEGIELTQSGGFQRLWKYGIAHAVAILLLYVVSRLRPGRVVYAAAALIVLGLAGLGLNFRSSALVCLLAATLLLVEHYLGARIRKGWRFAAVVGFGLLFSVVMPIVARAGLFGPALQRKTVEQDATDLPLLLAGRTEPPMTFTAIADRPLLGWGSAQRLTPEVYTQAEHAAISIGYPPDFPFDLYWRLPAADYSALHSIMFGSWAEGGILALLLPAWLMFAALGIIWNHKRFGIWAPIALTAALQCVWDLLYAPWTYNTVPEYTCIALLFCAVHFTGRKASP